MAIIGVNTFLWTTTWDDRAAAILSNVKRMGFDAVQIPLLGRDAFNVGEMRRIMDDLGLACYLSAGLKENTDITSDSPQIREKGIAFLRECVRMASQIGAPFLSGSFHSAFGVRSEQPVGAKQWEYSAESLKVVARAAQDEGFDIVLEPINRYESRLINTADQAKTLIGMIGEPNVKIQLDTFHMNMEEPDFHRTIQSVGKDLAHLHVAESHRGTFGTGMMPWDSIFTALAQIEYKGAIVIESFVPDVREVATAACIWRNMAPSADALAREGLAFIKELAEKYAL